MQSRGGRLTDRLAALEERIPIGAASHRSKAERDTLVAAHLANPANGVECDLPFCTASAGASIEQMRAAISAAWRANA